MRYNELTGVFTWIERPVEIFKPGKRQLNACSIWNSRFAGKEAGTKSTNKVSKTFYTKIATTLDGKHKIYRAHRLVFLYVEGSFPPEQIDHIDGNGLNNKIDNLRKVSGQENCKNRPIQSNNKSGHPGVFWREDCQKWEVSAYTKRRKKHGGYFTNLDCAVSKRKEMEIQYGYHSNHGRK